MRIVVDAGNGAGGFFAALLASLGADTTGSQFLDPNGLFPNHAPNPEDADAMAALSAAVVRSGADLGLIFDTDCDRGAVVGPDGQEINRNRLIAALAAIVLKECPGGTIVTDSVTSTGLAEFIRVGYFTSFLLSCNLSYFSFIHHSFVMLRLSCLVLSCLVLSCLVLSCLVLSCLVLSCLVLSCLVSSCLVILCV